MHVYCMLLSLDTCMFAGIWDAFHACYIHATSMLQYSCTVYALAIHCACTVPALAVHCTCTTVPALAMHCTCTVPALAMHCTCTTVPALAMHCTCTVPALAMHCTCTVHALYMHWPCTVYICAYMYLTYTRSYPYIHDTFRTYFSKGHAYKPHTVFCCFHSSSTSFIVMYVLHSPVQFYNAFSTSFAYEADGKPATYAVCHYNQYRITKAMYVSDNTKTILSDCNLKLVV